MSSAADSGIGTDEKESLETSSFSEDDLKSRSIGTKPSTRGTSITALAAEIRSLLAKNGPYITLQAESIAASAPLLAAIKAQSISKSKLIRADIASMVQLPGLSAQLESVAALARHMEVLPPLTNAKDYAQANTTATAYSPEMSSPQSYFEATEEVITSFDGFHNAIRQLIAKTPDLPLVWRGHKNAGWGLHSHLYRRLMMENKIVPPSKRPKRAQQYPDEDQMVRAEKNILKIARQDWRFDQLSALETFARIQHAGGPTRLIDVTKNPYIGAWFAVESDPDEDENDGRLFAIATKPVTADGKPPAPESVLQLDGLGSAHNPFWHLLADNAMRQEIDWGTGARRRLWVPPAYDPRITTQNAAFILDGVPMTSAKTAPYFTITKNTYWRRADLLASASIYAKMHKPTRKPTYTIRNFAPTFSFRITAEAKREIRDVLESRFGYARSYIYPDMTALADYLKSHSLMD